MVVEELSINIKLMNSEKKNEGRRLAWADYDWAKENKEGNIITNYPCLHYRKPLSYSKNLWRHSLKECKVIYYQLWWQKSGVNLFSLSSMSRLWCWCILCRFVFSSSGGGVTLPTLSGFSLLCSWGSGGRLLRFLCLFWFGCWFISFSLRFLCLLLKPDKR